ncbi:MAG: hypothetical protein ACXVFT_08890 [Solirubrobacteraceae bacterium]
MGEITPDRIRHAVSEFVGLVNERRRLASRSCRPTRSRPRALGIAAALIAGSAFGHFVPWVAARPVLKRTGIRSEGPLDTLSTFGPWRSPRRSIAPQQALAGLDALGLDDETRALFLGGSAQRVWL